MKEKQRRYITMHKCEKMFPITCEKNKQCPLEGEDMHEFMS